MQGLVLHGRAYPMASLANRNVHYYFTDDLKVSVSQESNQDEDEDVRAMWVRSGMYRKMKESGRMDAMVGHAAEQASRISCDRLSRI